LIEAGFVSLAKLFSKVHLFSPVDQ